MELFLVIYVHHTEVGYSIGKKKMIFQGLAAGFPNEDLFFLSAPFEGFLVGIEKEIDMAAFDGTSYVFNASPAIPGNLDDSAVGEEASVGSNSASDGACSGGGDADFFGFAFVGSVGIDGLKAPVPFPSATNTAFAVAGKCEGHAFGRLICWDCIAAGSGTAADQ